MEVYIWFKKRASIPLAPCIYPFSGSGNNTLYLSSRFLGCMAVIKNDPYPFGYITLTPHSITPPLSSVLYLIIQYLSFPIFSARTHPSASVAKIWYREPSVPSLLINHAGLECCLLSLQRNKTQAVP